MNFSFFLLLLLIPLTSPSFSIPIHEIFDTYHLSVCFSHHSKCKQLTLDMSIDYTWFPHYSYPSPPDSSPITTLFFSNKHSSPASITSDIFHLNNINNTTISFPYSFYVLHYKVSIDTEAFGLGFSMRDKKLSLINTLYEQRLISSKAFGFEFSEHNKQNGKIHFGKVPSYIKNKFAHKISIPIQMDKTFYINDNVVSINNTWGFRLNKVNSYINKYYSFFDIKHKHIFAPADFMAYLEENYFNEFIQGNECSIEVDDSTRYIITKYFLCECDIAKSVHPFVFVFEQYELEFGELFIKGRNDKCKFNIMTRSDYVDSWVFGSVFIRNYVSEFDYDERKVELYMDKPVKLNYFVEIRKMDFVVCVMLIVAIVYILGFKGWEMYLEKEEMRKRFLRKKSVDKI